MHITTIDVISANGKITRGKDGDAHEWSSDEDWQHFLGVVSQHNVLVMGSRTYDIVKPEPQPERLRIVLTSRPEDYQHLAVPGQLEFMQADPHELIAMLESRGYAKLLLVGGQVNTQFIAANLVDEMYITVEPYIFGQGRNLLDGNEFTMSLTLHSVKKLNERGTLVLRYQVDKH